MTTILDTVLGAVLSAIVAVWLRAREHREVLEFCQTGHSYEWLPSEEGVRERFPDVVGPGTLHLEYRAEIRNRGKVDALPRAWSWWIVDEWDGSHHYVPLDYKLTLLGVGERSDEVEVAEGDSGSAIRIPAGEYASLHFEGLFVVIAGQEDAGPEGCAPRFRTTFRAAKDYIESGEEQLTLRDVVGMLALIVR